MNKEVIAGLAWGGGIVALALCMTLARMLGCVDGATRTNGCARQKASRGLD